uniref:Uncharacterized protein n=1 Tax=Arundo donax TaxID=35708 RepID=A0A0A8ZVQ6_ARUDO
MPLAVVHGWRFATTEPAPKVAYHGLVHFQHKMVVVVMLWCM